MLSELSIKKFHNIGTRYLENLIIERYFVSSSEKLCRIPIPKV